MFKMPKKESIKNIIRKEKERERCISTIVITSITIAIIIVSGFAFYESINLAQNKSVVLNVPKAAIVDQLSLSIPNETFVQTAKTILEEAGYSVDYYSGERVNVEFYRNLAKHGYKVIILRVHSALGLTGKPLLALFTSEVYSTTKYLSEQLCDQLTKVGFNPEIYEDNNSYFGVMPSFIRSINGKFDDTAIIMMGCDGLPNFWGVRYVGMASAFIEKGAKVFISWSGPVLGSYSDSATICLLKNLLAKKQTIGNAVESVTAEMGSDPLYNSVLQYYPVEAKNKKI